MLVFVVAGAHAQAVPAEVPAEVPAAVPIEVGPPAPVERWPALYPGQVAEGSPNFDLEILYYEANFDEGLKVATERLAKTPSDKDLYWLKARFMYEIGERFQRTDTSIDKVAWYQRMLDTCDAGLKLAPGDPHLRFARGVAMGRLGTTRGVLVSLFMAQDVESDWLSVANGSWKYSSLGGFEMLPCDAYHALGIYYRLVPDWWIVQMIAGTRGDLDKSLAFNLKSTVCKPDEVENWKELGATQLCIGQNRRDATMSAAGITSLKHGLSVPAPRDRNKMDQKHCEAMITDPSLACEYSRDGQQDLDEKKLQANK